MGDEPLENINPNLAEAFGEHLLQARNIKEVRGIMILIRIQILNML